MSEKSFNDQVKQLCSFNFTNFLCSSEPPCIMCVQYIGGCSVLQGVFSTLGGYHEYIGGYHEYIRGCSVHWGIS